MLATLFDALFIYLLSVCAFQIVRVHTSARFGILITFCFYSNVFYFKALLRFVLFISRMGYNSIYSKITANLTVFPFTICNERACSHLCRRFSLLARLNNFTLCIFVFIRIMLNFGHTVH